MGVGLDGAVVLVAAVAAVVAASVAARAAGAAVEIDVRQGRAWTSLMDTRAPIAPKFVVVSLDGVVMEDHSNDDVDPSHRFHLIPDHFHHFFRSRLRIVSSVVGNVVLRNPIEILERHPVRFRLLGDLLHALSNHRPVMAP